MLSVEALRRVEEDAIASAVGLAQLASAPDRVVVATPEAEEQAAGRKEKTWQG